jgi:hypothetical protein
LIARATPVAGLGLRQGVVAALAADGIVTLADLVALNPRELRGVRGVGPAALEQIVAHLEARGLALAVDPFAPYSCARHGQPAGDASLATFFLCEECAEQWQSNAFDGQVPEYVGASVEGYCVDCNLEGRPVRLRQWFLCGTCERVARSIGRSVVAERFVARSWDEAVSPGAPGLALRSTDVPALRGRRSGAAKVAAIDFAVADGGTDVLGFEMKSGKGHIPGRGGRVGTPIATFQLDQSDCDDITTVSNQLGLPVYLLHVQVVDRAAPPTLRYVAVGAWWTDPFTMSDHYKHSARRPREARDAAYFDVQMFRLFGTLAEHFARGEHLRIAERLAREGAPALYPPTNEVGEPVGG